MGTSPETITVVERKGYRVLFDTAGVTYSSGESSLRWQLVSVGRRSASSTLPPLENTRWVGETMNYERGSLTETYELRVEGVKQSFVFDTLPAGSGDLVVRLALQTREPLMSAGRDEVYFARGGENGIRIEEVVGIDASGSRVEGALNWLDGTLELVLPAAFVDQAVLPLVLDPLVGEGSRIGSMVTGNRSSFRPMGLAYLPDADLYYAVWEDDINILPGTSPTGRVLRPDGRPARGAQQLTNNRTGPFYANDPQVAAVRGSQSFVVVMRGGLFFNVDPWVTVVDTTGNASKSLNLGFWIGLVDVGGNETPDDVHAVVVFNDGGGIQLRKIDTTTVQVVQSSILDPAVNRPGIASITPTEGGVGRYLVTWTRLGTTRNLYGAIVDIDLNVLVPPFAIAESPLTISNQDADGDGSHWLVVYEREENTRNSDVLCRSVRYDAVSGQVELGVERVIEADPGQDESRPTVAWLGESYLVGYSEEVDGDADVFVTSIDTQGQLLCEGKLEVFAQGTEDFGVQIASHRRVAGSIDRAMITWVSMGSKSAPFSGFRQTVAGQRLFTPRDGEVSTLRAGCGNAGTASASCARAGSDAFAIHLRHAAPNAIARLTVGLQPYSLQSASGALGQGGLGCVLLPTPAVTWTRQTDALGDASVALNLPPALSLAGQRFLAQWVMPTLGGSSSGRGLTARFSVSNGIEIMLE